MSEPAHLYVVTYDISQDGRRESVAKKLLRVGDRVQYSVFLLHARRARIVRLQQDLEDMIDPGDSIMVARLGQADGGQLSWIGGSREPSRPAAHVL